MSESRSACYAYCIVSATSALDLGELSGVHPESPVGILRHGDLSAVVSEVPLAEFGADALRRNLEDIEWLERTARAHDAVLNRALAANAVVPLRLCTIFAGADGVRNMLEAEKAVLHDALARLQNRSEWSVKVLADERAPELATERAAPAERAGAAEVESRGRAFFARKKLERQTRDAAWTAIEHAADDIHTKLAQHAAAVATLPPQRAELSGRKGVMVSNSAYLVDRAASSSFVAVAEEAADRYRGHGIDLAVSGPWAPYNFVTAGQPG